MSGKEGIFMILKIKSLVKNYSDFTLHCSLEIAPGCITGLIGKNYQEISKKDKQKLGVVLSDSGFSVYLTVKNIIKIMQNMYDAFEQEYFLSYCQKFQLPIQLKFGGEKGRLMMFVIFACAFFVGFFIVRVAEWQKVDIAELSQMFSKIPMICLAGILLLATILCVGVSYSISCKIMNKKEF